MHDSRTGILIMLIMNDRTITLKAPGTPWFGSVCFDGQKVVVQFVFGTNLWFGNSVNHQVGPKLSEMLHLYNSANIIRIHLRSNLLVRF